MTDFGKALLKRLGLAGLLMPIALGAGISLAAALEIRTPKAVIELFTSQGCSSCPAADRILHKINQEGEILGLAYHVDYWDRLGWKDVFATPEHTKRQWLYSRVFRERHVYTPQAVINGRSHEVGSRKRRILAKVEKYANTGKGMRVPIAVTVEAAGDVLNIAIPPLSGTDDATLYAVYFTPESPVTIKRGENAGRTVRYSNIVGKVETIGIAGAAGVEAAFSLAEIRQKGFAGCAFILQQTSEDGHPGPILGASVITGLDGQPEPALSVNTDSRAGPLNLLQ